MSKGRLEAFSDGVLAIIITIMVLELKIPLAFVNSWFAGALYVLVAVMWLVPDRRIETTLGK